MTSFFLTNFLGWYSWGRREKPGAKQFAAAALFGALWVLGTVLEVSAVDFSTKVFWVKFQTVWQLQSATAILCFVLTYAGLGRWLNRRNLILLAVPPILALILAIANDYHHLIWSGIRMGEYVVKLPGGANRIFVGDTYLIALVNFAVLIWLAVRSSRHRWPVAIMLAGQVTGHALYLLNNIYTGFMGPEISVLAVVGLVSSGYAFAFFRFHVFDPVPLARSAVVDQMEDGMLVLNSGGNIVDINSPAEQILGQSRHDLRGLPLAEVFTADPVLSASSENMASKLTRISLGSGKLARYYDLNLTNLKDKQGVTLGHMLMLHDITEQKQAQTQILEQQQVVATLKERERLARE